MERPDFTEINSGEEFNRWYWLKTELIDLCKLMRLPHNGGKFELRDRIMYALDNNGAVLPIIKKSKPQSKFNWSKEELSLTTIITDNVSFGPNFRKFMKSEIGNKFTCHSDFMDWVKANSGKTLKDAILKWETLEKRKNDPNFQRKIASHNMLSQYVRDFLKNNEEKNLKDALTVWKVKRKMPMKDGFVRYEANDLSLLEK